MSTPSLTVDITDTNLLLDDLLHQLSLHSDYALLRHIKQSYSAIHGSRQQQQAEVKRTVEELSRAVQGLEQSVRTVGVTEVKAWRDGVKGSVSEREEEVQELQVQAGRLAGEVEEKEEEGKELERKRKEMLRKHQDAMQSHKKCLRLYSILSAVQFDVVDDTQIRGSHTDRESGSRGSHRSRQPPSPLTVVLGAAAAAASLLLSLSRRGQRSAQLRVRDRRGQGRLLCFRRDQQPVDAALGADSPRDAGQGHSAAPSGCGSCSAATAQQRTFLARAVRSLREADFSLLLGCLTCHQSTVQYCIFSWD